MSLKDAILGLVEEMEAHAKNMDNPLGERTLAKLWAAQLRIACKVTGDTVYSASAPMMPAVVQHAVMIERAREEFKNKKKGAEAEGSLDRIKTGGDHMVEIQGGSLDACTWPTPDGLAEGTYGLIPPEGGERHQLRGGKWHYAPPPKEK